MDSSTTAAEARRPRRSGRPAQTATGSRGPVCCVAASGSADSASVDATLSGPTDLSASAASSAASHARGLEPVPASIDLSRVDLDDLDVASLVVDPAAHLTLDDAHAVSARDTDPL